MKLRIHNADRASSACFGGMPSEFDLCYVFDDDKLERNPLSGKDQPAHIFTGTLTEAHEYVRNQAKP